VPIYDYKCPKCGDAKEELVRPGEEKNFYCDKCKVKMDRQFPNTINFKLTDNFIMGRDKPPSKEVAKKMEEIKADPSKDPYKKFRDSE
jgi:putative FmdB family regulatory protein